MHPNWQPGRPEVGTDPGLIEACFPAPARPRGTAAALIVTWPPICVYLYPLPQVHAFGPLLRHPSRRNANSWGRPQLTCARAGPSSSAGPALCLSGVPVFSSPPPISPHYTPSSQVGTSPNQAAAHTTPPPRSLLPSSSARSPLSFAPPCGWCEERQ